MQFKDLGANRHGVAGVVSAIEAGYNLRVSGQQVDKSTLPLIAPLRSNNNV